MHYLENFAAALQKRGAQRVMPVAQHLKRTLKPFYRKIPVYGKHRPPGISRAIRSHYRSEIHPSLRG
jgi:hypothetical protein